MVALALAAALLAGACGPTKAGVGGADAVDPLRLAQVLPTPAGMMDDGKARSVLLEDVQPALAGRVDQGGVERLRVAGFISGAIREWTTEDGGRLTAVLSVWDEKITATNVGAGSVQLLNDEPGARAWTPSEIPGSQGVKVGDPVTQQALSNGVGTNLIFLRTVGPVPEPAIVRTMELAIRTAQGGLVDNTDEGR